MKNLTFSIILILTLLSSCSKNEVEMPKFDVSTSSETYMVGEEINFEFSGNPDNLTFYSGEAGKDYEHRNRTTLPGKLQIDFRTLVDYGSNTGNLSLLVTTDITGMVDSATVRAAEWIDITDRAVLSTGSDQTPSGSIDLSDLFDSEKPVSVAFKYVGFKSPTLRQNRWVIRTFNANSVRDDEISPLVNMASAGWTKVSFKNPDATWTITNAQLLMSGGPINSDENEDWVISKLLDPNFIKSDVGYVLKNISTNLSDFTYKYKDPGVYKIVFLASNTVNKTSKEVVKELTLTIKE